MQREKQPNVNLNLLRIVPYPEYYSLYSLELGSKMEAEERRSLKFGSTLHCIVLEDATSVAAKGM